jgi:hypothetical protein
VVQNYLVDQTARVFVRSGSDLSRTIRDLYSEGGAMRNLAFSEICMDDLDAAASFTRFRLEHRARESRERLLDHHP